MIGIGLTRYALAIIATLSAHGHSFDDDPARAIAVADSMANASGGSEFVPFDGSAARALSIVTLAVTAHRESGNFNRRVLDCRKKGDGGKSITMYQMMKPWALQRREQVRTYRGKPVFRWVDRFTEKEMCADMTLASEQALFLLELRQRGNVYATPAEVFQSYTSGSYKSKHKRAYGRCVIWQQLAKKFGLRDDRGSAIKEISCWHRPKQIVMPDVAATEQAVEEAIAGWDLMK